ncbi:MAG: DNA photolyase [Candidatus Binataceae bacterium]|nr:DNA photolyase [Candidatus Binataceae bacterium]
MKFELEALVIEHSCRDSALAKRIVERIDPRIPVGYVEDGRAFAQPIAGQDPFGAGKRRMILTRKHGSFVTGCPAASAKFACCGYLIMNLASNCPMDCSYCFLQEYLADNPGFKIFANYCDAFPELDKLSRTAGGRNFRIGTGELADSLAFDNFTGISAELVDFFAQRDNLLLELKTKTDEIENLLRIDSRGRTLVSWTLSPEAVFRSSERLTASPARRIAAARRLLAAGYRVGFHLDPIVAYPAAGRDYPALLDELFDNVPADRIAFISLGGLRMTPALRRIVRERFSADTMMVGEEVLAPDGRFRTFAAMRVALYSKLHERTRRAGVPQVYLCMEPASVHERVFGVRPPPPGAMGEKLAQEPA